MIEEWRNIPGYNGYYVASSLGRIKRLKTIVKHSSGNGYSVRSERIIKPMLSQGYLVLYLCVGGNKRRWRVHKLIANAFLDNPKGLPIINHRDGNKINNIVSNLEWISHQDNTRHAHMMGLKKNSYGKMIDKSKLMTLINLNEMGYSQCSLAKIFDMSQSTISRAINLKRKYVNVYNGTVFY